MCPFFSFYMLKKNWGKKKTSHTQVSINCLVVRCKMSLWQIKQKAKMNIHSTHTSNTRNIFAIYTCHISQKLMFGRYSTCFDFKTKKKFQRINILSQFLIEIYFCVRQNGTTRFTWQTKNVIPSLPVGYFYISTAQSSTKLIDSVFNKKIIHPPKEKEKKFAIDVQVGGAYRSSYSPMTDVQATAHQC